MQQSSSKQDRIAQYKALIARLTPKSKVGQGALRDVYKRQEELTALLARLDTALEKEQPEDHALALGLILQIFYLLNKPADESTHHEEYFPQNVLDIQHYLDTHFAEVLSLIHI